MEAPVDDNRLQGCLWKRIEAVLYQSKHQNMLAFGAGYNNTRLWVPGLTTFNEIFLVLCLVDWKSRKDLVGVRIYE